MSSVAGQALDTCEIVWWSGYVKGRFQAYMSPSSLAPRLVDESPPIRWRSSAPPGPTEAAVEALEALTSRLAQAGWTVSGRSEETWYGLVLSRPATEGERTLAADDTVEGYPDPEPILRNESQLDSALLAQLQSELQDAREETELERMRRIEAESGALRLVGPAPRDDPAPVQRPLYFVVYAFAVVVAAAIFLVGFHSLYAAVVAALTTAAVAVGVDSWLVVHRRTSAAR